MGEIKISSISFEQDIAVVWYRLTVGENSNAICYIEIPSNEFDGIFNEEKLITHIKNNTK